MKVDVKHNTSRESTHHLRNNQNTTRDIQIEAIDHTDIRTNRQEKCWKSPTDHGKTLDQHTIHHNTPRSQLHLNRHHNPNKMKKSTKSKYKGDAQHNTTQHNPHPIPPAQTPSQKNQLYSSDQRDTNSTYRTKSNLQITNPPTNLTRS